MQIKIIKKECGLDVGKVYDLCEMSAMTLLSKGQAVKFVDEPVKAPEPKGTKAKK